METLEMGISTPTHSGKLTEGQSIKNKQTKRGPGGGTVTNWLMITIVVCHKTKATYYAEIQRRVEISYDVCVFCGLKWKGTLRRTNSCAIYRKGLKGHKE